ncbi:MAG: hypothetical protein KatS3mg105_4754 [Gemmatales bacterium]|nr:MAG: hypothetical protein KatS3mg105_4754 [Gemmatales bacterium]
MEILANTISATAIATIYLIYGYYQNYLAHRRRILRERVAYMLWVAANEIE